MQALLAETRQEVEASRAMLNRLLGDGPAPALYSRDHYEPITPAVAVHASKARFVALCAGVRSGKTFLAGHLFLERIEADYKAGKDRLWYWCVAPTYSLSDMQREYLEEALFDADIDYDYNAQKHLLKVPSYGVKIWFKSADRDRNLRARGIRGVWMSEAAAIKETIWESRIYSRLSDLSGWGILEGSPEGHNWFWRFCKRSPQFPNTPGSDKAVAFHKWATHENSAVPVLVEECRQAKDRLPAAIYAREYEADFDTFIGQIYEEWDAKIHVCHEKIKPEWGAATYAYDWGYSVPGCLLAILRNGDGERIVVDEVYQKGRSLEWWAKEAKKMTQRWGDGPLYFDPSRNDAQEIFHKAGVHSRGAENAVIEGIDAVMRALHPFERIVDKGGVKETQVVIPLRIGAACKNLIGEMPMYQWDDHERPIKRNDHALDALRYAIYTRRIGVVATGR